MYVSQGRIQDFNLGGRKRLYTRTHITSAKSEVPFGRSPELEEALGLGVFNAL